MQVIDEEISACEEVALHVRRLIATGDLRRGMRLPSYRDLAVKIGVAPLTAKRGVDLLVEQGIVRRRQRQGCFVNRELDPQGRPLRTVGIIHATSQKRLFTAPYLAQIMQGISGGPSPLDVHIFTMREQGLVSARHLADDRVDGAILVGVENDAYLREFVTWGVPGVVVDYFAPGIPLDFVACDNAFAAQRAVRHLTGLGHRWIRYVGTDPGLVERVAKTDELTTRSSDSIERREAMAQELARCPGVRWDEEIVSRVNMQHRVSELAAAWRRVSDRPTAFLMDNEHLANTLIQSLEEQGVSVPGDVSVCVVAMGSQAASQKIVLAGAQFDFVGMGRKAVELLQWRCEKPAEAAPPAAHRIGFEWVGGGSTREACG